MIKTASIEYQNMMDIAIQECGGIASVFDLALLNGLSVTEELAIGTKLQTPTVQTSADVAQFLKKQGIKIATNIDATYARQQLFEDGLFQPGLFE